MSKPLILFAPGAGAPSTHPWMRRWAELLGEMGIVQALDYPYMLERRRRPDRLPELITAHRAALRRARESHPGAIFLAGKSMGSRIGCHVALEEKVTALICFGYPLCGGGDPSKLRDKVLLALRTPILFVQGTRDLLCPLELLERVRSQMTAPSELHAVDGGDHSLQVGKLQLKRAGETQDAVDRRILANIENFISRHSVPDSSAP